MCCNLTSKPMEDNCLAYTYVSNPARENTWLQIQVQKHIITFEDQASKTFSLQCPFNLQKTVCVTFVCLMKFTNQMQIFATVHYGFKATVFKILVSNETYRTKIYHTQTRFHLTGSCIRYNHLAVCIDKDSNFESDFHSGGIITWRCASGYYKTACSWGNDEPLKMPRNNPETNF